MDRFHHLLHHWIDRFPVRRQSDAHAQSQFARIEILLGKVLVGRNRVIHDWFVRPWLPSSPIAACHVSSDKRFIRAMHESGGYISAFGLIRRVPFLPPHSLLQLTPPVEFLDECP